MTAVLAATAVDWILLTVVGVLVLTPLRRAHWVAWLPAAPVVGAAFLAVALHATSGFAPIWVGLIVVVLVLAALVGEGLRRGRRPWRAGWRPWLGVVAAGAAGVPGAVAGLLPNLWLHSPNVVAAGTTLDSFFYVSEANWLTGHGIYPLRRPTPVMGGLFVPGYGPAFNGGRLQLRMGQPMIQSVTDLVTGRTAVGTSMSWMACYVILTAAAALTLARLLGWSRVAGGVLAVLVPSSAALVYMVRQQNQDSLLGIPLAMLAAAAVIAAADRRAPRALAALLLAGLIACYVELTLFAVPLIFFGVVGRVWGRLPRAVLRAVQVLGLAVLMAPLAWWRGAHSVLANTGGGGDRFGSPYLDVPVGTAVGRLLGAAAAGGVPRTAVTVLLAVPLVIGVLGALAFSRHRAGWAGLLLFGGGYVVLLTVQHRGYSQSRVATLLVPLLLVVAVAGGDALVRRGWPPLAARLDAPRATRLAAGGLVVVLALALAWPVVNLASARQSWGRDVAHRWVDPSYQAVSDWVAGHGGPGGADVSVVVPDLFAQSWVINDLRGEPDVQYPALNSNYTSVASFTRDLPTRFLVTGRGAMVQGDPAAAVFTAGEFTVWDTTLGSVVTASPDTSTGWNPYTTPGGSLTGRAGQARILITRSPRAPRRLYLRLQAAGRSRFELRVGVHGGPSSVAQMGGAPLQVPVDTGDDQLVHLSTTVVTAGSAAGAPQFALSGVVAGS